MNREQKIQRILAALRRRQMTRHEISETTGIPLESVCGRVNELLHYSKVEVSGFRHCAETGKDREVLRIRKARKVAA